MQNITDGTTAVSTHSRLKAAGELGFGGSMALVVSTHSRLKAAGAVFPVGFQTAWFQHTAA